MNNEPLADFGVTVRFYKDNIERTFIFHNCSRKKRRNSNSFKTTSTNNRNRY